MKVLQVRDWTTRKSRDFNEEHPKLRLFTHISILIIKKKVIEVVLVGCRNSRLQFLHVTNSTNLLSPQKAFAAKP